MQIQYFYSILFIELVNDNFICRYGKEWSYGKLISEAYDIISVQAQTHHSTVYLVRHKKLDVLRTAKFVRKDTGGYMRILREADFLKILRHSGIPLIYDIAEDKDSICIIEEFISGKSLTEYVAEHRMLTAAQITDFVLQICDILEYLHSQGSKGMVHLDLKPDNILITDTGSVKLIDFDNAVRTGERYATHYGSIGFAAPEQYHRLYQDCRADIYSLGMLILYMDNGHVQCHAESLHHKKFYSIVKKCIHHSIWQRYRSVKQVRQAVYSLQAENELSENIKAQNISLYGTKHGVGTTHIALCLTAYLTRNGFRAVYVQEADEEDFICEIRESILQTDGTFRCGTIAVCPQYHGAVQADLYGYDYIVRDCGTIAGLSAQADIKIVVTDFGYRRRLEYERLLQSDKDSLIFVNHTDGNVFYKETGRLEIKRQFYRIPCVYDWNNGSKLLDRVFLEALSAVISKPCRKQVKGGAGAGRKYIISKNK